jgi:hypothetical protein
MRGLFLISILIALVVAAYLHTKSANTVLETENPENKMEQVEQEVNAALESHMQNLQIQGQQE